ncbi:hypothetical protein I551_8851 [Mycobacterium ulcerans str. Harvey]|uniref:Uncharacterized protein n=1 Tax=Mycobacterium ulcerans str. Harvey TaxID=1299332 RepID=A0ABN0R9N6_MYCUL|nr:hypothetical protein I551_8851 [Mycobacterium ulcerans str. Harvey]
MAAPQNRQQNATLFGINSATRSPCDPERPQHAGASGWSAYSARCVIRTLVEGST